MEEILMPILASVVGVTVAALTSIILSKNKHSGEKTIEYSKESGKTQKIRVQSLDHDSIKKAIETEIALENLIRSTLKDISRSNGKIKISEGETADFIAKLGDEVVIIEAKSSLDNLTKDFFKTTDKKLKNYHSILVVNEKPQRTPSSLKNRDIRIISTESKIDKFKENFTSELNKLLKAT